MGTHSNDCEYVRRLFSDDDDPTRGHQHLLGQEVKSHCIDDVSMQNNIDGSSTPDSPPMSGFATTKNSNVGACQQNVETPASTELAKEPQSEQVLNLTSAHKRPHASRQAEQNAVHGGNMTQKRIRLSKQGGDDQMDSSQDRRKKPSTNTFLILQPLSQPIPDELLDKEVNGIEIVVDGVEGKCRSKVREENEKIRLRKQRGEPQPDLDPEQWASTVSLHRVLLNEMHDFFLASQYPTAHETIKSRATRKSMPARMWKFGIHDFLELLRSLLPFSLEYMLSFLCLAYQIVALLYETVPVFEETWMECLGDLARYRMAIEEKEQDVRENWTEVARYWYSKVIDSSPNVGRLQHHIAVLSRSFPLKQLAAYNRSLTAIAPFLKARESIMRLYRPILARDLSLPCKNIDEQFIRLHGLIFEPTETIEVFDKNLAAFSIALTPSILATRKKWREIGAFMAISNIAAQVGYEGTKVETTTSGTAANAEAEGESKAVQASLFSARKLMFGTLNIILELVNDKNVVPHVHLAMVLLFRIACVPADNLPISKEASRDFLSEFPLGSLCRFLNHQLGRSTSFKPSQHHKEVSTADFPASRTASGAIAVLEEDYLLRGQFWSADYLPNDWYPDFSNRADTQSVDASPATQRADLKPRSSFDLSFFDDSDHVKETTYSPQIRIERVSHLAKRIAACQPKDQTFENGIPAPSHWIWFEPRNNRFEIISSEPTGFEMCKHEVDVKLEDDKYNLLMCYDANNQRDHDIKMED